MNPAGILSGIGAALSWGSGDFGAGIASRKATPLATLAVSQAVGLAVAIAMLAVGGEPSPGPVSLTWAVLAGASGAGCLLALYHGLATRPMGVISSIAAVVGVVLPVLTGALTGDRLRPQDLVGIGLAIVAIALVTRPTGKLTIDRTGLMLAILSGAGAAGFFIGMGRSTAAGGATWWPIAAARSTSLLLAALLTVGRGKGRETIRSVSPLLVAVGVLDMAGNAFFLLAESQAALSLAVVVSSQYPAVTAALAAVALAQRPSRIQAAGILMALGGIALISTA